MEAKRPLTAVALACILIVTALAALAPTAQANDGCSFGVGLDGGHSPANTWSTHDSPRWTFNVNHCRVTQWGVSTSWGGYFETGSSELHPTLPSGEYSIAVRALYTWDHWHSQGYWQTTCSWWWCWSTWVDTSYNHVHQEWTPFVSGAGVKIDVTVPEVAISDITGPYVDDLYLTSATTISLSASDAHSGLNAVQTAQDGGGWTSYDDDGAHITGEDGARTFSYRAIDNVGWITAKSRDFILDNTAPVISIIHPTPNSLNVDALSAETCTDNARVTNAGETVAEAPAAPELPPAPVDGDQTIDDAIAAINAATVPGVPEDLVASLPPEAAAAYDAAQDAMDGQVPSDLPDAQRPSPPPVVDNGPDACGGHLVSTVAQQVTVPGAPEAPEVPDTGVEAPEVPATPEVPAPPVGPGDVLPPTVADMVEDAAGQIPGAPPAPGAPAAPTFGTPRDELESAIGPIPVEDPTVPDSVAVDAASFDFANPVVLTGVVEMSANVDDATVGTSLVEFIVDGVVRDSQSNGNADYAWSWDTTSETAGEHSFAIRAVDRLGNEDLVEFTVIVLATTQEGIEATAAMTQAELEGDAAQAQADAAQAAVDAQAAAEAAPGEAQAAAEAAPGDAEAAAAATQADAESRAATANGYVNGRASEILPDDAEGAVDDAVSQLPPI